MDLEDLLEAWRVNNVVNLELLALCEDEHLEFKPSKGKTIRSSFVHIVSSRTAWLVDQKEGAPKLDWKAATRSEIQSRLASTETLAGEIFAKKLSKPDRFKLLTFFAYMVAHEAHHRAQIELALRLNGAEPPEVKLYSLWDWAKK